MSCTFAGARILFGCVCIALTVREAAAQNLSLNVKNIPASATRVSVVVDGTGISGSLFTFQNFAAGTTSTTVSIGAPVGGPYRIRAHAYDGGANGNPLLRSGKATGVMVSSGSTAASINLGDVAVTLDPITPLSAAQGSAVKIGFDIADPGDVVEGAYPSLYSGQQPFSIRSGGTALTGSAVTQAGAGNYVVTYSVNLPAAGSAFYYGMNLILPSDGNVNLYSPNPNVTATPWLISLVGGAAIQVNVKNIPASATRVSVVVDGAGISGSLSTFQNFAAGTTSTTVSIGAPVGGPYRIRAHAYDGGANGNPLLRSGKAAGVMVSSGSTAASINLGDVAVALNPITPLVAAQGSAVKVGFDIADPGDVVEGAYPSLYSGQQPFSIRSGGTAVTGSAVTQAGSGNYVVTYSVNLPTTGSAFYYGMNLILPSDGNVNLYSPNPSVTATPWLISLVAGSAIQVNVKNIPASATRVSVVVDGAGISGSLFTFQNFAAGTTSTTVSIGAPVGGPYRIRAHAYDGGANGNPLLRSGKAAGVMVSSGSTAASIELGDVAVTLDSITPLSAAQGSAVKIGFDIVDPGDVVEGAYPSLYSGQQPFSIRSGGTALTGSAVTQAGAGNYVVTYSVNLPAAGSAFYYGMNLILPSDGNVNLYSPSPNMAVSSWQMALGADCQFAVDRLIQYIGSTAVNGSFTITGSRTDCPWNGQALAPWLSVTSAQSSGTGSLSFSASANSLNVSRTGTIQAAGHQFTITQAASGSALPSILSIAKSHVGNFTQGQSGATHTVTVSNADGAGPTNGTVTVTESTPGGMTLVSMDGTGWNCSANICTRGDVLNGGSSYPPITVNVNVAANAVSQVINQVSVSGGGSAAATATDPTIVLPRPVLSIAKTHAGNFLQGQNGATYKVTVSNAAGAGATGGTVTVTETPPGDMALVSMTGTGWSCAAGGATCSRSDVLNPGSSYPTLTVTVNVSANAAPQVSNQVSVSGGGSATARAADNTSISQGCAYFISPAAPTVAPAGGNGSIVVTSAAGCGWSVTSNVAWLSITGGNSGVGSGGFNYAAAANPGSQRSGTITIAGQTVTVTQAANNPLQIPSLVSLTPFQGTGPSATLTLVYSHPSGWAAIRSAEFLINPRWEANARGGGCYVKYTPATGLFALIGDDGNSTAGTIAPGAAGAISNSQCSINGGDSAVTGNGNTLTIVASVSFQSTFAGQRHIWMQAVDYNNFSTNWLVYGVWIPAETTVSASPWYRIYDPFSNSYLYSFDKNEYDTLGTRGFVLQGISGLVMDSPATVGGVSNIAWYRVFVNGTNSHLWTSDRNEFLTLVNAQQAYVGEGVAAFVMPYINAQGQVSPQVTNTIPFYRAAFQGRNLHFWTADSDEFNGTNGKRLPAGYVGEGVACYIFPASGAQFGNSAMVEEDDGVPMVLAAGNGVIAPGQALSIYGRHLGGQALFNGAPAQIVVARDNEIVIVAPDGLSGLSEVTLTVEHRGRRSRPVRLDVVPANPAIFGTNQYGRGNAQARNQDGTINEPAHPAARGSLVTLDATGGGLLDLPVEVHVGGRPAEVVSWRQSGTRAGVVEVRIRVPEGIDPADFQPVVLHIGNLFSQPGIGLAIQ